MNSRIVLLHATPVAMQPIQAAFSEIWPEAETVNLLDDGLSIDRARHSELTDSMIKRFITFGQYGSDMSADGILVTCSAFGPAIDALAATLNIPVLKPNDAMFEASISRGNRIGMLATFEPSISTMNDEFEEQARRMGIAATLETVLVRDALDFLKGGDAASHNRLLAAQAPKLAHCDAIMLAHFSTSRALEMVQQEVDAPIFTAPHAAVTRMRALVERNGSQVHL